MPEKSDTTKSRTEVWLKFLGTSTGLVLVAVLLNLTGAVKWKDIVELVHGPPKTTDPAPAVPAAAAPLAPTPRVPAAAANVLADLKADLERLPAEARKGRRYLSLVHLHNDPRVSDETVAAARDALRALAGYLSPPGTVAAFRPIDEAKLVYAIDWADLGADPTAAWRTVLRAYPYGLDDEGAAAKAVRDLAGTPIPAVRGDWFARAAVSPALAAPGSPLHRAGAVPAPLREFAQRYDEQRLDAAAAAGELGVADPKRVAAAVAAEEHLRLTHKLAPLATGGSVTRSAWESTEFVMSPFQELARVLAVGTPLRAE